MRKTFELIKRTYSHLEDAEDDNTNIIRGPNVVEEDIDNNFPLE